MQTRVRKRLAEDGAHRPNLDERRRLAALTASIKSETLAERELIVTIATLWWWHRGPVDATCALARRGRRRFYNETERLVVRLAHDNPTWGQDAIRNRLAELGIVISDRTVSTILRRHCMPPASESGRRNDRSRFIAQWPRLAAINFAIFEVPDGARTRRYYQRISA